MLLLLSSRSIAGFYMSPPVPHDESHTVNERHECVEEIEDKPKQSIREVRGWEGRR